MNEGCQLIKDHLGFYVADASAAKRAFVVAGTFADSQDFAPEVEVAEDLEVEVDQGVEDFDDADSSLGEENVVVADATPELIENSGVASILGESVA